MFTFLLWCVVFALCWPIALLALVLYPIVWVLLLPFRIVGIAVEGIFVFLRALFMLPARLIAAPGKLKNTIAYRGTALRAAIGVST